MHLENVQCQLEKKNGKTGAKWLTRTARVNGSGFLVHGLQSKLLPK